MKADPESQAKLLELQRIDTRLDRIVHHLAHLPEQAALDEVSAERTQVDGDLVRARTDSRDIARASAKAEADVQLVRDRATRDHALIDGGRVTPKELTGLQHELESLARRQTELEDDQLDVMMREEALEGMAAALATQADDLAARVQDATARRDEARDTFTAEAAELTARRAAVAPAVGAEVIALYDKIRAGSGGVGAAALKERHCDGCRLELLGTDYQRVIDAPPDELVRCEECRRILVRSGTAGS